MYIKQLLLQHFGKYNNREIDLQPGLNLIYGPNEAGKTTLKDFIIGMFYGIERQRGIASRTDEYMRHEPLDGSGYAGSMELQTEDGTCLIERNFRKDQKILHIYQDKTGREVQTDNGQSLYGTLVDLDKNGYTNTLCISSNGAAYKSELQEQLKQYLMNVSTTHTGNLNLKDANAYLSNRKKELNQKGLENELQALGKRLVDVRLEENLEELSRERQKLEEKLVSVTKPVTEKPESEKSEIENQKPEREERKTTTKKHTSWKEWLSVNPDMDPQLKQILTTIKVLLGFGVAALIFVLIFILPISLHYKGWLCVIVVTVAAAIWIMGKHRSKRKVESDKEKQEPRSDDKQEKGAPVQETETGSTQILTYSNQLTDIQVRENDILREYAKQQELQKRYDDLKAAKERAEFEARAIDLAAATIQELSENIFDQYGSDMNEQVSEMVSKITNGAYTDVKLDEQLRIKVRKQGRYIGAEHLSTGTLEQIYLAVRLAAADEMSTSGMPIILDDIFGSYDDARLEAALQCIADYRGSEQILLFTASDRIADTLDKTKNDYNYVEL